MCILTDHLLNVIPYCSFTVHLPASTPCPTLPTTASTHPGVGSTDITKGATATTSVPGTPTNVRLPRDLQPTDYVIRIQPEMYGTDPTAFTFHGEVNITLSCLHATSSVSLHINKLTVRFAILTTRYKDRSLLRWPTLASLVSEKTKFYVTENKYETDLVSRLLFVVLIRGLISFLNYDICFFCIHIPSYCINSMHSYRVSCL